MVCSSEFSLGCVGECRSDIEGQDICTHLLLGLYALKGVLHTRHPAPR